MKFDIFKYKELPSTNDTAKKMAAEGAYEGTVIVAQSQTNGRGRAGHKFYSPQGGIYCSIILRPKFSDFTLITPAASVAVCRALDNLGFTCRIKWVNDIYKGDKKVCGILTEADVQAGWAVLGIGLNTVDPGKGAPEIAGYLYDGKPDNETILKLILDSFFDIYKDMPKTDFISYYRERAYLKDKTVLVEGVEYRYKGIDGDFGILLEKDGKTVKFKSGEVSVKPQ